MARLSGKDGTVSVNASVLGVTSWEIDYKGDAIDVTGMDSSGAKAFIGGLTEWSGTVEGHWESTAPPSAALVGTQVNVSLVSDNATPKVTCAGAVIVTGLKIGVSVDANVTYTYTFQGTGALTVTPTT
jgi:predicted secreted protein